MTIQRVLAAALGLALAAGPARADDATSPDRDKVKEQLHQTLKNDGHLSDKAVAALDKGIDKHAGDHGYGEAVSTTVHQALQNGCTGTCLAEAIHQVNHAMDQGRSAEESGKMVDKAVAGSKGTEMQRRDRVRRDMAMSLRDGARDRMHDRAADMGQGGRGGGMGGGMMGGKR